MLEPMIGEILEDLGELDGDRKLLATVAARVEELREKYYVTYHSSEEEKLSTNDKLQQVWRGILKKLEGVR